MAPRKAATNEPVEPDPAASANAVPINPAEDPAPEKLEVVNDHPVGDVFDNLEALRLKQDFNRVKVKRPFTLCPIRKPRPHEWFQVHPDPAFRFEGRLFKHKEGMSEDWYLPVGADVLVELEGRSLVAVVIFVWVNRKRDCAIWPIQLGDEEGKINSWHESMHEMFTVHAIGQWARIESGDGGYKVETAQNEELPPPEWPQHTLAEILRVAFKGGRVVDSLDHPLIKKLRGLI